LTYCRMQHCGRTHHKKLAQISVSIFVMRPRRSLPPLDHGVARGRERRRTRARSQRTRPRQPSRRRHSRSPADARYRHQAASLLVAFDRFDELVVDRCNPVIQRIDLSRQRRERNANALGNHDLAVLIRAVRQHPLQSIGVLGALGRHEPILLRCPCSALSCAVR
jgi:hypothetical protein